ncbi:hypothetical protein [Halomicrococcus sp. SG-WS-1]|uniref:hypothetical protein n=1 Tax=Halomicrococcus sp. SG-WS-1 TaxID=3439057 RepID=UPI003F7AD662
MSETADKPEPYIADSAPEDTANALHSVIDPLLNPEDAGDHPPGIRAGSQEHRKERWVWLTETFATLQSEYRSNDRVLGLEIGYFYGVGDHPIGLAVATSTQGILNRTFPDTLLQLTTNEDLRLVDETVASTIPVRVAGFALPPITAE